MLHQQRQTKTHTHKRHTFPTHISLITDLRPLLFSFSLSFLHFLSLSLSLSCRRTPYRDTMVMFDMIVTISFLNSFSTLKRYTIKHTHTHTSAQDTRARQRGTHTRLSLQVPSLIYTLLSPSSGERKWQTRR